MSEIREVERITGDISVVDSMGADLASIEGLTVSLSIPEFASVYYDGSYEIDPTDDVQTLQTQGLVMRQNLKINPVPDSYGHIAWNGTRILIY